MTDQGSPATPPMLVCDECNANGCPPHYGDEDCKPGCVHPSCRAREIADGIAEIGAGGTPAFIRGYNVGFDDAWAQCAEDAAAPGLREALEALLVAATGHVALSGRSSYAIQVAADKAREALAAAPAAPAADARLRDLLSRCQNAVELNAVHSGSPEARALAAELRGVLFPATADTPEATE